MQQSFMPNEQQVPRGTPGSRKKPRPVELWARFIKKVWGAEWYRKGRYESREIAEKVAADQHRKYPGYFEFSIGDKPQERSE